MGTSSLQVWVVLRLNWYTHSRLVSLEDQLCLNQDEAKEVIHIKGEMSKTLEDHSLTIDSQDDDLYKKDGQPSLA